jgi:hypothetical protein
METEFILMIVLLVIVIGLLLIFIGRNCPENYIQPKEFKISYLNPQKLTFANLGNDKVLYPINGLGVDYNTKEIPRDAPCAQFLQPP